MKLMPSRLICCLLTTSVGIVSLGCIDCDCETNDSAPIGGTAGSATAGTGGSSGSMGTGGISAGGNSTGGKAGSGKAGSSGVAGTAGAGGSSGGSSGAGGSAGAGEDEGFTARPGENGSQLVPAWHDEFDGPDIDTSKWYVLEAFPPMDLPWRRNWKKSNVFIQNGALIIQTIKESDGSYSTGAIRTGGYNNTPWLFSQTYGRFEARMKRPTRQGHWAAFWIYTPSVTNVDGSGRDGTEIDIAEFATLRDEVHHALHWDGYGPELQSEQHDTTRRNLMDGDWHTVAVEW